MKEKKFNLIEKMKKRAERYGVNVRVFLWIYFGSMILIYGSAYIILSAIGFFNIKLVDIINFQWVTAFRLRLNNPIVLFGLIIHLLGWISPYLYVAIAGKGLKSYVRVIILGIGILLIVVLGGLLKI